MSRCLNDYLNTAIGSDCPPIIAIENEGWLMLRSEITGRTITDAECDFTPTGTIIKVRVPGDLPYKPKVDGTRTEFGLQKFDKTVEFFFIENSPLTVKQIQQLINEKWVLALKDFSGQYMVFGLETGLKFFESSQELSSLETHGGVLVTMKEIGCNVPMMFAEAGGDLINALLNSFPEVGDEYGGGIVAMADPVSGELVIVPDAEALGTITGNTYDWLAAIAFAESYSDGVNSDYRLLTNAEAVAILGNAELVAQLGLPGFDDPLVPYWTTEEVDIDYAWGFNPNGLIIEDSDKSGYYYALPIRKVNFYGLPLIGSEYGGGLVYDVVAATRMVYVAAKWADVESSFSFHVGWDDAMNLLPDIIGSEEFEILPTRAQALKIFGNSYLVTLLGLPVDENYWTSEEFNDDWAYAYEHDLGTTANELKTLSYYALPVRSEVVPET